MRFIFALVAILSVSAQDKVAKDFRISGKIVDKETQEPLEYATVVLNSKTTKAVTGGLTDVKGEYSFIVPNGIYDISFEYISFESYKIFDKVIDKDLNLGTVELTASTQGLDEVVVVAEKSSVEVKLDKRIFNVGKDITVRGGTAGDVLSNIPSVSLDAEGKVALRGSKGVRILINGKPSALMRDPAMALRQLPADAIEKVEVITSPSARYDATGTSGILNIILRREKLEGLNGSVTANVGHPTSGGVTGIINYRHKDFDFFAMPSYGHRASIGRSFLSTDYVSDQNLIFEESRRSERRRNAFNLNLGSEWHPGKKLSVTASLFHLGLYGMKTTTNKIFQRDSEGIDKTSYRISPKLSDKKVMQYSMGINKKFKKEGENLSFNFQHEKVDDKEDALITQNDIDIENVITLEDEGRTLLQTDYVLPIGNDIQFELGYRGDFRTLSTDYTVNSIENEIYTLNTSLSNALVYREYVNAAYLQCGSDIRSFSLLLGLRMEDSRIDIEQQTSNSKKVKIYTNFFPTVNLGYEIKEGQSVMFSYNRRIVRPTSWKLNPFPSRSSATSLFQGNPDLNPEFSNGVDLGYLTIFKKLSLTFNSSIYYRLITGIPIRISEETGDVAVVDGKRIPIIKNTPINLASRERFGIDITATYNPTKKWRLNMGFNIFNSVTKGYYKNFSLDANNTGWLIKLNNNLTLPWDMSWQTILNYYGPSVNAQSVINPIIYVNLALSKNVLNKKASLVFKINDVFNSRKFTGKNTAPSFTRYGQFQWKQRSFALSFAYYIKQQSKKKRSMNTGQSFGGGGEGGF